LVLFFFKQIFSIFFKFNFFVVLIIRIDSSMIFFSLFFH